MAIVILASVSILDDWYMTLATIVFAALWSVCGYFVQSKIITFGGVLMTALLLISELIALISIIDLGNWMMLSILGGSIIVVASILDRHGVALKERTKLFFASR